jgi:stearoyl-CoA 9-desaturase NADPH oxidoreductase
MDLTSRPPPSLLSRLADIAGLIATPLRPSHYLELVNPLWTTHTLQARVEKVWDETRDSRTLTLRPGRNWRAHRAGQHVRLGVPIDGMQYTRTYSLSSSPDRADGCITVTVKAITDGRMSHHLVRKLEAGTYLPLGLPQGDFVLPDATPVRPLFITAGSGITPVMSMLRTYVLRRNMPDVVHVHYAPHHYDVIFGGELREIVEAHPSYRLRPVYTRELGDARVDDRHFCAEQLEELCPDWSTRDVWACGPQGLLDSVEAHFTAAGRGSALHTERFRAALAAVPDGAAGGRVRFAGSAREVDADGTTNLLRVAEDAGLNPPHGCRMGICHSCDVTLVSGSVRDLRTNRLVDAGSTIQICVCAAAGDVEVAL